MGCAPAFGCLLFGLASTLWPRSVDGRRPPYLRRPRAWLSAGTRFTWASSRFLVQASSLVKRGRTKSPCCHHFVFARGSSTITSQRTPTARQRPVRARRIRQRLGVPDRRSGAEGWTSRAHRRRNGAAQHHGWRHPLRRAGDRRLVSNFEDVILDFYARRAEVDGARAFAPLPPAQRALRRSRPDRWWLANRPARHERRRWRRGVGALPSRSGTRPSGCGTPLPLG
jgi:hypothetical protein